MLRIIHMQKQFVSLLDHLSQSVNHDYRTTQQAAMIYKRLAELSEVITPTYGLHGTIIENGHKFISILLHLRSFQSFAIDVLT